MATTKIIPMHIHRGLTISQSLSGRLDYAKNPEKTEGGQLVSSYECSPECVDADFMLSKLRYNEITGLKHKNNVIAYQVRQSFKPGQVSAEEANQIGYEFAMRFTKGRHAFIVATHIDKAHIHNHIIWNSTALDCTHKYRNFWGSTKAVIQLSDLICVEHGLSIIENPKLPKGSYNKWLGGKFTGKKDLESTIFKVNKEATIEIAKQLRLRDIDGIIIIDYIDMQKEKNTMRCFLICICLKWTDMRQL